MASSMTGYGRGSSSQEGFVFLAELRAVNHRYADFLLRLPRELYALEDRIRKILQDSIKRGRVEVNLIMEEYPPNLKPVNINFNLAEGYYRVLQELTERLHLDEDISVTHLLQMPELFKNGAIFLDEDQVWPAVSDALQAALANLMEQRRTEGNNLSLDLSQRCDRMEVYIENAVVQAEIAKDDCRQRTEQKITELMAGKFDETRLLMECALLVERMGVDEELVRLKSHITAFRKTLNASGAVGRKLDFLAQEMFREINTVGSKAGDYQLTGIVVDAKAEIEKIREQIQNLE